MDARKTRLIDDRQGAIMMMGLFMAISLIGSLWFILGIGEAIVLRDKAIEASDHAAFSAATVHARGMNYIAALNLIMFALTVVYVGMCLIADVLAALGTIGGFTAFTPPVCEPEPWGFLTVFVGIGEIAEAACEGGQVVSEIGVGYANILGGVFKGIGALETVIQVGMPVAAEAAAIDVTAQYAYQGDSYKGGVLSPSLIPGISKSDKQIGLPVKAIEDQYLCDRSFNWVKEKVSSIIPSPFSKFIGWVLDGIKDVIDMIPPKATPVGIGCNGGTPWGNSDVHVVNDGAGNGTDTMQIWSLVLNAQDKDANRSEPRVGMSEKKGKAGDSQKPKKQIYYSQAEYYFDCTKEWTNAECYDNDEKQASFQMAWRARLRRVYAPSFGNKLVGLASSLLLSGGNLGTFAAGQVGNTPGAQKMADSIGKLRNGALSGVITGTDLGNTADGAMDFLNGGDKPIH